MVNSKNNKKILGSDSRSANKTVEWKEVRNYAQRYEAISPTRVKKIKKGEA